MKLAEQIVAGVFVAIGLYLILSNGKSDVSILDSLFSGGDATITKLQGR